MCKRVSLPKFFFNQQEKTEIIKCIKKHFPEQVKSAVILAENKVKRIYNYLETKIIFKDDINWKLMPKNDHPADETFEKYKKLLSGETPSECEVCGGPLVLEKVNLEDYQGGKLYMMEGVPAYVCQECGEVWVPEPIMNEFEKMIETAKHHVKTHKKPKGEV